MTKKTKSTNETTTPSLKTLSEARRIVARAAVRKRWDTISNEDKQKANEHLKKISRLGVEKRKELWKQQQETSKSDANSLN